MKNKPIQISTDEWWYKGCFIQKNDDYLWSRIKKFSVFKDTSLQETIDNCWTMNEAKSLCKLNEVKNPYYGYEQFLK